MTSDTTGLRRAHGLTAAAATDCGRLRDHNEDVFYLNVDLGVFLVVDGVGGQAAGEVAAQIAADRIRRRVERQDAPAHVRVREAITLANREILLKAQADPALAGMACVLTLAVLEGQELTIGHVGDSRIYQLDARGIAKLTHDHSPVGELEDTRGISEPDAMQHDRRNEVYRDVGSEPRDPDANDFIELVRTSFESDSALLLCSDGLTDMVSALEVNRIVRCHAGAPDAAVAALIEAANVAGGKDNVTAMLVEGPAFRRTPDGGRAYPPPAPSSQEPTLPLLTAAPSLPPVSSPVQDVPPARVGAWFGRTVHTVIGSRGVALVGGVVLGLFVPAGFGSVSDNPVMRATERLMTIGGSSPKAFGSIGAALAAAAPGDVIQIPAGEYAESITVPAGVELRAASAGAVVFVAPAFSSDWTAITAGPGSTIRGVRVAGTPTSPMARGITISGDDVVVDDVLFEGAIDVGIDVTGAGTLVRSSRFEQLAGTGIRLEQDGASLRQNVFRASGADALPAVTTLEQVSATFDRNVFVHFPHPVDPESRAETLIGRDNFVIAMPSKR